MGVRCAFTQAATCVQVEPVALAALRNSAVCRCVLVPVWAGRRGLQFAEQQCGATMQQRGIRQGAGACGRRAVLQSGRAARLPAARVAKPSGSVHARRPAVAAQYTVDAKEAAAQAAVAAINAKRAALLSSDLPGEGWVVCVGVGAVGPLCVCRPAASHVCIDLYTPLPLRCLRSTSTPPRPGPRPSAAACRCLGCQPRRIVCDGAGLPHRAAQLGPGAHPRD